MGPIRLWAELEVGWVNFSRQFGGAQKYFERILEIQLYLIIFKRGGGLFCPLRRGQNFFFIYKPKGAQHNRLSWFGHRVQANLGIDTWTNFRPTFFSVFPVAPPYPWRYMTQSYPGIVENVSEHLPVLKFFKYLNRFLR